MSVEKSAIGARLRSARDARGWTREELAQWLRQAMTEDEFVTPPRVDSLTHMIKEWEKGKHGPNARYRALYASVFETAETELFRPVAALKSKQNRSLASDLSSASTLPELDGRAVGADFIESIRETTQALVRLDGLWGGAEVFPLARRTFGVAHRKAGTGNYIPEIERDLIAATGELGEVAAWLAYDADQQVMSRRIIHEAMLLSRQAGDRDMELFELSHLAMQSLHVRRSAEALRITSEVLDAGRLTPRVAALFEMRRGRALAQAGDERRALDALDKAGAALADGVGAQDPHWTWWVDATEVTWHRATAFAQLGKWPDAAALYEEVAAENRGRILYSKLDLAQLLGALVQIGDWSRAEDIITEAAALADSITPGRGANVFRSVLGGITREKEALSTVSDTAEHLLRILDEGAGQ